METIRGNLGFEIPVQIPNKKNQVEMNPNSIMAWRSQLPIADVGNTAKQLYLMLNDINQTEMAVDIRFKLLEIIKPTVQLVCQNLKKHYMIDASILSHEKVAIANLAKALQLEMAYGYKQIIEDLEQKKPGNKDHSPVAIGSTIEYLTAILLRCCQLYSPAPEGLWRELHLLYQYTKDKNLSKYNLKQETNANTKKQSLTLENAYKHAVLLAASNPYQWRQNEQEAINNALDLWAPYVTLNSYSKAYNNKPSIYIIHPNEDIQPEPLGLNQIEPNKDTIVLDLSKLVSHLKEIANEMAKGEIKAKISHEGDPEYELSYSALQHILNTWKISISRKNSRYNVTGRMQLVFSLYATHYYFNGENPFDPQTCKQTTANKAESKASTSEVKLPVFDAFEDEKIELAPAADNEAKNDEAEDYPIYPCTMIDVSPTGACLMIEEQSLPPIQAGEIITMRPEHSQEQSYWNVGVVCWIKHADRDNIKVGIQILAPSGKAAAAQILKDNESSGYFLRCLLLPEMKDLNTPSTIITPTVPFSEGKTISIYLNEHQSAVKAVLTKEVNSSGSFKQFEYKTEDSVDLFAKQPTTATKNETPPPSAAKEMSQNLAVNPDLISVSAEKEANVNNVNNAATEIESIDLGAVANPAATAERTSASTPTLGSGPSSSPAAKEANSDKTQKDDESGSIWDDL